MWLCYTYRICLISLKFLERISAHFKDKFPVVLLASYSRLLCRGQKGVWFNKWSQRSKNFKNTFTKTLWGLHVIWRLCNQVSFFIRSAVKFVKRNAVLCLQLFFLEIVCTSYDSCSFQRLVRKNICLCCKLHINNMFCHSTQFSLPF